MLLYVEQDGEPLLNFGGDLKEVLDQLTELVPAVLSEGPDAKEVDVVLDMPHVNVYWIDDFGVKQSLNWEIKSVS